MIVTNFIRVGGFAAGLGLVALLGSHVTAQSAPQRTRIGEHVIRATATVKAAPTRVAGSALTATQIKSRQEIQQRTDRSKLAQDSAMAQGRSQDRAGLTSGTRTTAPVILPKNSVVLSAKPQGLTDARK